MKRKKCLPIILLLFTCVLVVSFSTKAEASGKIWMTIFANNNNTGDPGHCFLNVENAEDRAVSIGPYILLPGEDIYLGARNVSEDKTGIKDSDGGVFGNYEPVQQKSYMAQNGKNYYRNFAFKTIQIQVTDLPVLYEVIKGYGTYSINKNNCAQFARKAWNAVVEHSKICTDKDLVSGGVTPSSVRKSILNDLGGDTAQGLKMSSKNSRDIVIFTSDGGLMPYTLETSQYNNAHMNGIKLETVSTTAVEVTWSDFSRKLGNNIYRDITHYQIEYGIDGKSATQKGLVASSKKSKTISGLKTGMTYQFRVRGISDHRNTKAGIVYGRWTSWETIKLKEASLTLNKTSLTIMEGKSAALTATVVKLNDSDKLKWKSSNNKVATVSGGKVTAESEGKATITATCGTLTATCKVTVTKGVTAVSCGYTHTAIIKEDGSLWMCGQNNYGQVTPSNKDGGAGFNDMDGPLKIMTGVKAVSCGDSYTAIIKEDGSLWMCGCNEYGQLGDGTTTNHSRLVKVMTDVEAVSCGLGWDHTAILKTDGSLWMCGHNGFGELGDDTRQNRTKPVKVMTGVKAVSCGSGHTAILKKNGSLWMCGYNQEGELGNGIETEYWRTKPVKVMTDVEAVSCGGNHTAVLKKDGSVWTWGSNMHGELGNKTTKCSYKPVKIMTGVKAVSCGATFTAILKTDGSLWMCGDNRDGVLGNGTTTNSSKLIKVMTNVKAVSCGGCHVGILKNDNSLWMCGGNWYGQLGDDTKTLRKKPVKCHL